MGKKILAVLGNDEPRRQRARARAAFQYLALNRGVEAIVFAGYNGEADNMCRFAFPDGLEAAPCRVLLEATSKHTLENAERIAEVLTREGYAARETELVVVTSFAHLLRAYLTFRGVFPTVSMVAADHDLPPGLVLDEARKIVQYSARGHLYPARQLYDVMRQAVRVAL